MSINTYSAILVQTLNYEAEIKQLLTNGYALARQKFWEMYPLVDEIIVTHTPEYDDQGGYYVSLCDFTIEFVKSADQDQITQFLSSINPELSEVYLDGDDFSQLLDEWEDLKIFTLGEKSLEDELIWYFSRENNTFRVEKG